MAANSGEVSDSIEIIANISQQNSATSQEVSASAEEMSAQVQQVVASSQSLSKVASDLQTAVAGFNTNE
jgi:methyl-accepting chemotaxis protein